MNIARHLPANWTRIIDQKISAAADRVHREMLKMLKQRFMCASQGDVAGFLGTFAPDFVRNAYIGGTHVESDLAELRSIAELGAPTWPEIDQLMIDGDTIAVQGVFNVVIADEAARRALNVKGKHPGEAILLSAQAALFIQFRGGLQVRETAYGGQSPKLSPFNEGGSAQEIPAELVRL